MITTLKHLGMVTGFALCLGISACTSGTPGQSVDPEKSGPWSLVAAESGMTYVTIKNGSLGEINTFRDIDGRVKENGAASFTVNLDSIDTANEIRDGRMREHLFETAKFPTAKVTSQLDMTQFEGLKTGASETVLLDMKLNLHDVEEQFDFYVQVTRLGPNKVVVTNKAPLLLDADDFGFTDGLATLQKLAGLNDITPVVPVTVSLVFER